MTLDEQMTAAALAEASSYRRLIEQCRHRAFQEEGELRNRRLSPNEQRVRAALIWAKFTLSTADMELACIAIEGRLAESESLKPIRVAAL